MDTTQLADVANRLNAAFSEISCVEIKACFAPNVSRALQHLVSAGQIVNELIAKAAAQKEAAGECQP